MLEEACLLHLVDASCLFSPTRLFGMLENMAEVRGYTVEG